MRGLILLAMRNDRRVPAAALAAALVLPSAAAPLRGPGDELGEALLQLSADRAHVREQGERYLAGHVTVADFSRLARIASDGDTEVTTRLARAIGSRDENLELAALFLAESEPSLRQVGEDAALRRMADWNDRLSAPCLTGTELQKRLFDASQSSYPFVVRLDLGGSLVDHCSALQREAGLPVGITISTQLFDREPIREGQARFEGDWLNALMVLARMYGVGLELHGIARVEREEEELQAPRGAFLRFAPLSELGARNGLAHMLEWFRTLASSPDANARRRAAHNLARTGWPGALSWMQERALRNEDDVAWSGLAIAAAHGRRAPLCHPEDSSENLYKTNGFATARRGGQRGETWRQRLEKVLARISIPKPRDIVRNRWETL